VGPPCCAGGDSSRNTERWLKTQHQNREQTTNTSKCCCFSCGQLSKSVTAKALHHIRQRNKEDIDAPLLST
jgi:hypothetical protein